MRPDEGEDEAGYQAAVRVVMRELFGRCAQRLGLPVPPGALPTSGDVDAELVERLNRGLEPVDGVDGFGRAYESLLAARDRKHAGAHYTPRVLADEVVEHALAPLLEGRRAADVLDLRILDIATGSGVFLVSAAQYLAHRFPDGPPVAEVIAHCLYGADVNPTTVEVCRLSLWLLAADPTLPLSFLDDRIVCGDSLLDVTGLGDRQPVSWTERAPDVIGRGGFDAVIGNPPFLGVKNIRTAVGRDVRDHYARTLLDGESGRSDLVVFFLARAVALSRDVIGLVMPDAIAEGDSARFGLERTLRHGFHLYRAETSRPWPGAAGVRIALIWLRRTRGGERRGRVLLDGHERSAIGPHLGRTEAVAAQRGTEQVPDWLVHGHQATIVLGTSLVLTRSAAADLVAADPRVEGWVRDYLSGEDLVSTPGPTSSRRVLDLGRSDLASLRAVPALAGVLEAVRAEREQQFAKYPQLVDRWWGFLNPVDRLYDALAGRPEAIAFSKHAKYVWPVIVPTGPVFSNGIVVYPTDDRAVYAFLASTPHRLWAVEQGGSRLNQSHRYNPSRLRATYPFPLSIDAARASGERLDQAVRGALDAFGWGVTDLLNRVHGTAAVPAAVAEVRNALVEVDRAVLAAHGIHERPAYAVRAVDGRTWFGPEPRAEETIRARLLG